MSTLPFQIYSVVSFGEVSICQRVIDLTLTLWYLQLTKGIKMYLEVKYIWYNPRLQSCTVLAQYWKQNCESA